jgi:Tol biopolymer transport system component
VLANWQGDLFTVDIVSGVRHQVPIGTALAIQADWANDGSRIVYRRPLAPRAGIWIVDLLSDTDTLFSIAGMSFDAAYPHWSPVDDLIACSAGGTLYDGSKVTKLAEQFGHVFSHPRWLPDGQSLLVADETPKVTRTLMMSSTGANARALPRSIGLSEAISPDGTEVIVQGVANDDSTHRAIVLYRRSLWDVDGSTLVQLTFAQGAALPGSKPQL